MKYWVDFSGYMKVEATSADEAERKFWHFINKGIDLSHGDLSDDVWDIDGIEAVVEEKTEPTPKDWEDFWHDK